MEYRCNPAVEAVHPPPITEVLGWVAGLAAAPRVAAVAEQRVLSQLKIVIRTNYSNPPTHGGAIVASVLSNPELRKMWEDELAGMRVRIKQMREALQQAQGDERIAPTLLGKMRTAWDEGLGLAS